ncbi:MAG: tRNA-queuosine alpha-mannosyltransferase domain-containing protein [Verrucomicrobiota bacterium]
MRRRRTWPSCAGSRPIHSTVGSCRPCPPRKWKWRMRTSALHFAAALAERPRPDLLFVTDYLNLAEMKALLPGGAALDPDGALFP